MAPSADAPVPIQRYTLLTRPNSSIGMSCWRSEIVPTFHVVTAAPMAKPVTAATATGGEYLPVNDDASAELTTRRLAEVLQPQPQTTILPGTPDDTFAERRNASLLWLIAAALTFEWVVRRLQRLA